MAKARRVEVTRTQALAAQLIENLDKREGLATDSRIRKIADAGRAAGVALPSPVKPSRFPPSHHFRPTKPKVKPKSERAKF